MEAIKWSLRELHKKMKWAVSGQGQFSINKKICELNNIMFDKFGVGRKETLDDFIGYFFANQLIWEFDEEKGGIDTYITYKVYYYLLEEVKKRELLRQRECSLDKLIEEGADPSNDFMKKGDDGVWRVTSEVIEGANWAEPKNLTPEEHYLIKELESIMYGYITKHYPIEYLELFRDRATQQEVAEELDVSQSTVSRKFRQMKLGLAEHLKGLGYETDGLLDI